MRARTFIPFGGLVVAFKTSYALSAVGLLACATPERQQATAGTAQLPEAFDPGRFTNPTRIDNPWMPLKPGTRLVYEGTTVEDDGTKVPHKVVINVTDLTKVISGVRTVITWDLDYSDGELVEAELAFFAQDSTGAVWRVGEYPEEYEEGRFIAAPAWIHGLEEARAGIMMHAEPKPGTPSYAQGWGPAVNWTDRGQVDQVGQKTCVPVRCFEDVLVIAETSAGEPDAQQLKYYARGVGNVRVGWRGAGEKTMETLELTDIDELDEMNLAQVRTSAMTMERNAYQRSKTVYAQTAAAERAPAVNSRE